MRKILSTFLLFLFLLGISTNAYAADMGDKDKNIALTVVYQEGGKAIAGAPVQLYKIASMDKNFHITADPTFAGFRSDIENENTRWDVLSVSLLKHILAETIPCDDETKINTSGLALFPTGEAVLKPGVYLLHCPNYRYNGRIYYASPVIISLSNYRADGQLTNRVTANIKYYSALDLPIELVVEKKWDDAGYEEKRPDKIIVDLLKEEIVVSDAEVELSDKNNWKAAWTDLDPVYDWDVKERAVSGYTAAYNESPVEDYVKTITITNTYQTSSSGGGGSSSQKLPQTGQLTWPIPVMIVTGSVLLALGWWLCCDHRKGSR